LKPIHTFAIAVFVPIVAAACSGGGGSAAGSAAPTPLPSGFCQEGSIVIGPCALTFAGTGASFAQFPTMWEDGPAGYTFSANLNNCTKIVSVGPYSTVLPPAPGTIPWSFTVTPNAAGSCTLEFVDANGNSAPLAVTVP